MENADEVERDFTAAIALLCGLYEAGPKGLKYVALSSKTEPTETEAREALSRILLSISRNFPAIGEKSEIILSILAEVFAPHAFRPGCRSSPLKAVLQWSGHNARSSPYRDYVIIGRYTAA